jgi:hypothetical protein
MKRCFNKRDQIEQEKTKIDLEVEVHSNQHPLHNNNLFQLSHSKMMLSCHQSHSKPKVELMREI